MNKESEFKADLERRVSLLETKGNSPDLIKLVRTSALLQIKYLPFHSVLRWLDDQILRSAERPHEQFKDKP